MNNSKLSIQLSVYSFFVFLSFYLSATTELYSQLNFKSSTLSTTIGGAQNLISFDIDGDGDLDILSSADKMAWWENKGELKFDEHIISEECNGTITSRPFDIEDDGDIDIVASHYDRKCISIWRNDGRQNFVEEVLLSDFNGAHDALAADLNSDNNLDIIAARGDSEGNGEIKVLIENNGSYIEQVLYSGDFCHSVDAADINQDGKIDIVSTQFNQGVRLFTNLGEGAYEEIFFPVNLAHYVRFSDFDKDGDMDFICAALTNSVVWWENIDGKSFTKHKPSSMFAIFCHPADVDLDGDMDILLSDPQGRKFRWLENEGTESFKTHTLLGTYKEISGAYCGDLDSDGDIDLLSTTWRDSKKITLWENLTITSIHEENLNRSGDYRLYQNYPNPFNPETIIEYSLKSKVNEDISNVRLKIFDLLGEELATLVDQAQQSGQYSVSFDASNFPSGIYIYQLEVDNKVLRNKMVMLK